MSNRSSLKQSIELINRPRSLLSYRWFVDDYWNDRSNEHCSPKERINRIKISHYRWSRWWSPSFDHWAGTLTFNAGCQRNKASSLFIVLAFVQLENRTCSNREKRRCLTPEIKTMISNSRAFAHRKDKHELHLDKSVNASFDSFLIRGQYTYGRQRSSSVSRIHGCWKKWRPKGFARRISFSLLLLRSRKNEILWFIIERLMNRRMRNEITYDQQHLSSPFSRITTRQQNHAYVMNGLCSLSCRCHS